MPPSCPILGQRMGLLEMPKSVAQLTGLLVTAIVTFGTDLDLTYAMLLGVAAGALATFFVSLSEARQAPLED
jgi:hypothetical protein